MFLSHPHRVCLTCLGAAVVFWSATAEPDWAALNAAACELVDWCEDQFTVWSDPIHHMDWQHWKMPTALEQYEYYTPIDASMGDMIGGFAAAYAATKDPLYLAKARALADNVTRHQRADGTIPTYFDGRKGSDWANCMIFVADRLETLAAVAK